MEWEYQERNGCAIWTLRRQIPSPMASISESHLQDTQSPTAPEILPPPSPKMICTAPPPPPPPPSPPPPPEIPRNKESPWDEFLGTEDVGRIRQSSTSSNLSENSSTVDSSNPADGSAIEGCPRQEPSPKVEGTAASSSHAAAAKTSEKDAAAPAGSTKTMIAKHVATEPVQNVFPADGSAIEECPKQQPSPKTDGTAATSSHATDAETSEKDADAPADSSKTKIAVHVATEPVQTVFPGDGGHSRDMADSLGLEPPKTQKIWTKKKQSASGTSYWDLPVEATKTSNDDSIQTSADATSSQDYSAWMAARQSGLIAVHVATEPVQTVFPGDGGHSRDMADSLGLEPPKTQKIWTKKKQSASGTSYWDLPVEATKTSNDDSIQTSADATSSQHYSAWMAVSQPWLLLNIATMNGALHSIPVQSNERFESVIQFLEETTFAETCVDPNTGKSIANASLVTNKGIPIHEQCAPDDYELQSGDVLTIVFVSCQ